MKKIQPHCSLCKKPFKRSEMVYTDSLFNQIHHIECFIYKKEIIKDVGTYEEIVKKYPEYMNSFIITDKPITNLTIYKNKCFYN